MTSTHSKSVINNNKLKLCEVPIVNFSTVQLYISQDTLNRLYNEEYVNCDDERNNSLNTGLIFGDKLSPTKKNSKYFRTDYIKFYKNRKSYKFKHQDLAIYRTNSMYKINNRMKLKKACFHCSCSVKLL